MTIFVYKSGVVVIITAHFHSTSFTKLELRFCGSLNPARGVSEIRNGEDLTRNPEIENTPIWGLTSIWRLELVTDTRLGMNIFNSFVPNAPFLYPLKTWEYLTVFSCLQGVEKGCIGNEWVKESPETIGNCVFLQNFHTRKLGEITASYAVFSAVQSSLFLINTE